LRLSVLALAFALSLCAAMPAAAQRLRTEVHKNSPATLNAFAQVVEQARQATVRIACDGTQVAMGIVVDADGYILTKASELSGENIEVYLHDGIKHDAELIGSIRDHDLAMLKVDATDLTPAQWCEAQDPRTGDWVATVGHRVTPVAVGVVSIPRRAIPRVGGVLGVGIDQVDEGVLVSRVFDHSGAKQAGMLDGDIIVKINGRDIKTVPLLQSVVTAHDPGDELEVTVQRGEETKTLRVTLSPRGEVAAEFDRNARQQQLGGELSKRNSGFPAVLQHDTVLRPRDVGGPLVDLDGKVVGVNIARAGRIMSYALPAAIVRPLIKPMKDGRHAPKAEAEPDPDPDAEPASDEDAKAKPNAEPQDK
jgi:serine protease Do